MVEAFNIIQDRIARSRLAGDPPDVMIGPKLGKIGQFDFHRAAEAIDIGYETARKMAAEIGDERSRACRLKRRLTRSRYRSASRRPRARPPRSAP